MFAQDSGQVGPQGALSEQICPASKDEHEAATICLDGRSLDIATVVAVAR